MTLIALLVVVLIVIAGGIAYLGDRLGTYVGRRRLSLFGARPRTTGAVVGVLAGILIMLSTLGVLAFAFQNATRTLLNVQRTLDELNQLRAQQRVLDQRVNDANVQLAQLRDELEAAQATIETAESQRDAAFAARAEAETARDALLSQMEDLAAQAEEAEARVATAQAELDTARDRLEATEAELDDANARLTGLTAELDAAGDRLAEAEEQVLTAQADLATAEAARAEAFGARDAAIAERDAAFAQSAELTIRVASLNSEVAQLEESTNEMLQRAQVLSTENATLVANNEAMSADNERLQQQNRSLTGLNDVLEDEIRQRNVALQELQGTVDGLRTDVERQARDLADLQQEFQRFEGGEVYFAKDQLIYSGSIYAQEPAAVREELAAFVSDATAFVARRGVERIRVTSEQFNLLVEVITQTPGPDLVRFISPSNQISSTIDVVVEALENDQLFERGQLIVTEPLYLGTSELPATQDEIRAAIAQLKAEAVRKLRRAGLDDGQLPNFGPVTEELFTNMLLRLTGPVTIGLVATEPVMRAGPADLELLILY